MSPATHMTGAPPEPMWNTFCWLVVIGALAFAVIMLSILAWRRRNQTRDLRQLAADWRADADSDLAWYRDHIGTCRHVDARIAAAHARTARVCAADLDSHLEGS